MEELKKRVDIAVDLERNRLILEEERKEKMENIRYMNEKIENEKRLQEWITKSNTEEYLQERIKNCESNLLRYIIRASWNLLSVL